MRSVVLLILAFVCNSRAQDRVLELLMTNEANISKASKTFGISPRLLASVIFAEQSLNLKRGENVLEVIFAHTGYNSSIGIAQIKFDTAEWIEEQLNNRSSEFYIGASESQLITSCSTRDERIRRLDNPDFNCLYAAAYIGMISKLWWEVIRAPQNVSNSVGIIATLYSLGIMNNQGNLRNPHPNPRMNQFGRKAQEFFQSFLLRAEFPE